MTAFVPVRRALLSASNKEGLVAFASGLVQHSVELLSTGGTARLLRSAGLPVTDVAQVTGSPEMLDGRVKTLHPRIHGALLAIRGNPEHARQLAAQNILPIDLVAITLYPFEATLAQPDATVAEAIEQIDIGGPAMLRSAAKNFDGVAVVVDPEDYPRILDELGRHGGAVSWTMRRDLARKAFGRTAHYDALISGFFERLCDQAEASLPSARISTLGSGQPFPAHLSVHLEKIQDLRYGENPHQRAAFYRDLAAQGGLAAARQLQGKELSYNNLLDLHAAWETAREFAEPAVAVIKHNNPCGVAVAPRLDEAYTRARDADPVSAFGGIIGSNRPVDADTARTIVTSFIEAVIAPDYTTEARQILAEKKNLRLLALTPRDQREPADVGVGEMRRVSGGMLAQDRDACDLDPAQLRTVTHRSPTAHELAALRFAWKVAKHVKSNAIVLATEGVTLGIGAGQMSRVDAVKLAILKATAPTQGSVLASDAFFPFRDGVETAADAGITALIQPGGSVRDADVIAAADERGLAMVFTGIRHFRH